MSRRLEAYANRFRLAYPTGSKYGKLEIIEHRSYDNSYKKSVPWGIVCRCDCGTVKFFKSPALIKSGRVKSCGCFDRVGAARAAVKVAARRNVRSKYPRGAKYGRLTVVGYRSYTHASKSKSWGILCRCDCGNVSFSK